MGNEDTDSEQANGTSEDNGKGKTANSAQWWVLEAARRIPEMKYGIGLVGVIAVVAIALTLVLGRWTYALFGGAVVIAGMFILRIYAAWQPKVARMDISGPVKVLIWTVVVAFILLLSLGFAWLTVSVFSGKLASLFTPQKRIDESFREFVSQVRAADDEGRNALASLVRQYQGGNVHWEDCIVVEVVPEQRTYRLAATEDTPDKYQAMAEFDEDADFKSFKEGHTVDIEGTFDTVSPFAIILYDCRFAPNRIRAKKGQ